MFQKFLRVQPLKEKQRPAGDWCRIRLAQAEAVADAGVHVQFGGYVEAGER